MERPKGILFTPEQRKFIEEQQTKHEAPEVRRKLYYLLERDKGVSYDEMAKQGKVTVLKLQRNESKVIRNGELVPGGIEKLRDNRGRPVTRPSDPIDHQVGSIFKSKRKLAGLTHDDILEMGFPGTQSSLSEKENGSSSFNIDQFLFLIYLYRYIRVMSLWEIVKTSMIYLHNIDRKKIKEVLNRKRK